MTGLGKVIVAAEISPRPQQLWGGTINLPTTEFDASKNPLSSNDLVRCLATSAVEHGLLSPWRPGRGLV